MLQAVLFRPSNAIQNVERAIAAVIVVVQDVFVTSGGTYR